jgi:hypothetical protein
MGFIASADALGHRLLNQGRKRTRRKRRIDSIYSAAGLKLKYG